jgi:hypothetical protein
MSEVRIGLQSSRRGPYQIEQSGWMAQERIKAAGVKLPQLTQRPETQADHAHAAVHGFHRCAPDDKLHDQGRSRQRAAARRQKYFRAGDLPLLVGSDLMPLFRPGTQAKPAAMSKWAGAMRHGSGSCWGPESVAATIKYRVEVRQGNRQAGLVMVHALLVEPYT